MRLLRLVHSRSIQPCPSGAPACLSRSFQPCPSGESHPCPSGDNSFSLPALRLLSLQSQLFIFKCPARWCCWQLPVACCGECRRQVPMPRCRVPGAVRLRCTLLRMRTCHRPARACDLCQLSQCALVPGCRGAGAALPAESAAEAERLTLPTCALRQLLSACCALLAVWRCGLHRRGRVKVSQREEKK